MTTSTPNSLHPHIVNAIRQVREALSSANIGGFTLNIRASGRTATGEDAILIEYSLSPSDYSYSTKTVTGGELSAVVSEVINRHIWDSRNRPLALAAPSDDSDEPPDNL